MFDKTTGTGAVLCFINDHNQIEVYSIPASEIVITPQRGFGDVSLVATDTNATAAGASATSALNPLLGS